MSNKVPSPAALKGSLLHYARPRGCNLLERTQSLGDYVELRLKNHVLPYSRSLINAAGPETTIQYDDGATGKGLNFASQDYLAMNNRPEIREAAIQAINEYGVHSAGSPTLLGNTVNSLALEEQLAEFLKTEYVVLFPTGWGAAFGTIVALVGPTTMW
ncbi:MAG: pyridoxal phosphate-dependent aminotransferase family protein [Gammaproteobacteria bacterium]|nr:pyridoxal phosphate-dependent aminotransferase family protein [Gammaproteobacteria bacterium]